MMSLELTLLLLIEYDQWYSLLREVFVQITLEHVVVFVHFKLQ